MLSVLFCRDRHCPSLKTITRKWGKWDTAQINVCCVEDTEPRYICECPKGLI